MEAGSGGLPKVVDFGIGTLTILDGVSSASKHGDIVLQVAFHEMTVEDVVLVFVTLVPLLFMVWEFLVQACMRYYLGIAPSQKSEDGTVAVEEGVDESSDAGTSAQRRGSTRPPPRPQAPTTALGRFYARCSLCLKPSRVFACCRSLICFACCVDLFSRLYGPRHQARRFSFANRQQQRTADLHRLALLNA